MSTQAELSLDPSDGLDAGFRVFAEAALSCWSLPAGTRLSLLSVSENGTYRVDAPGMDGPLVLRVHRTGYHSRDGVRTELAWMQALQDQAGVSTPQAVAGRDGAYIQEVAHPSGDDSRFVDLFHFIPGEAPDERELQGPFRRLGEVAGRMHHHARAWRRPEYFSRLVWDFDGCIGRRPNWGDWREGPGLDAEGRAVLEATASEIGRRLTRYGRSPRRYGLIHSDLRLANLLIHGDDTRVIDFDDCGLGWFMYDVASSVSFIETRDDLEALVTAWLAGYRRTASLEPEDLAEIPTFIMLRRMTLLAWLGTHAHTDMAIEQGDAFGRDTVALARRFMNGTLLPGYTR
ncbi:Ser/Thr protein kinase RdoA (MazF antagonist) [Alkalispirillum mobile]|uniref:Ser/Thr protein kinase RdoA (MazF antagonist) n=1 Tax=Alkalispirillum mobile TaxID=85925 RepID=A0A498CGV1_9GAMM|nr:phosphotransferase [Alkalispirillum mobile]RLK51561.1 Ser/Thr protein kinase RdoA (MazF antagonist) [Alkalispirillum mobile]